MLRLFHGHMDECLAIPCADQGDDQRRWLLPCFVRSFLPLPCWEFNQLVRSPSGNAQIDQNIILHIPELPIMKVVLFAVMLDPYGD